MRLGISIPDYFYIASVDLMEDRIKLFIYDVDGVLNDYVPRNYREYLSNQCAFTTEEVSAMIKPIDVEISSGRIDAGEFDRKVARLLGMTPEQVDWEGYYERIRLNEGTLGIVKELRSQGYKLAILTNEDASRYSVIQRVLSPMFDASFASYAMPAIKPNPVAYEYVIEKVGLMSGAPIKNNEVVFIDDSMENVESAAKIGIHALHFSTSEKLQADLRALLKTDIKAIQRESRIDAQKKRVT